MSANQPPASPPPSSPPPNRGALIAIIGAVALLGIIGGVVALRGRPPTEAPVGGPVTGQTTAPVQTDAPPTGAFDVASRPEPVYAALETGTAPAESPELFWIGVSDPKATHQVLRKNAWLDQALKDPLGQGFVAAWGGFFGTRGEDIGSAFSGPVTDLVLDQVLGSPYRIVWYGGAGAKGVPALVVPNPTASANAAFDTLVKVAASGGFNPPACAVPAGASAESADGGAVASSIHRVVLADKILFVARLADRLVLAPRPHAVELAMCGAPVAISSNPGVVASLGFSLDEGGRGTQSVGALLGLGPKASLEFGVEGSAFVPKGFSVEPGANSRLAAVEPSPELLKAIPEKSGVVVALAVKLPRVLSAQSLRDTLADEGETFKGTRKTWEAGPARQVAVIWNPRGRSGAAELAVLWANTDDQQALTDAMAGGNGALTFAKACSVLAYASTKELLADVQASCSGKKPSVLQAAKPVVQGLSQSTSVSLTVNLGRVLSQLAFDGYASENSPPTPTAGPQEIEAARRLLEALPTVGFRATVGADGKIVSGGFKS